MDEDDDDLDLLRFIRANGTLVAGLRHAAKLIIADPVGRRLAITVVVVDGREIIYNLTASGLDFFMNEERPEAGGKDDPGEGTVANWFARD